MTGVRITLDMILKSAKKAVVQAGALGVNPADGLHFFVPRKSKKA